MIFYGPVALDQLWGKKMKLMYRIVLFTVFCGFAASATAQDAVDYGTSGVNNDGLLNGTASITGDSVYGAGGLALPPGDDNYLAVGGDLTDLDQFGSYTYMTWVKQVSPGQKGLVMLGNCCTADGGDPRNGYTMNITGTPEIRYWAGSTPNDSNHNAYESAPTINDGAWHHVAIRVQEGQVDIFVDGASSGSDPDSNIPTQPSRASTNALSTNVPKIGGDGISENSGASSVVDEVRVYGFALSDQEIMDAMNGAGPPPDRLYYTFDDAPLGLVTEPVDAFSTAALVLLAGFVLLLAWNRRRFMAA